MGFDGFELPGLGVWGLGFEVWGSRVWGLGFWVKVSEARILG